MNWKKITPAFILGAIAVIFGYDTIVQVFGSHATISEAITTWIHGSNTNLAIFLVTGAVICSHFLFSKYPKDTV